jgi:hypothetical protein
VGLELADVGGLIDAQPEPFRVLAALREGAGAPYRTVCQAGGGEVRTWMHELEAQIFGLCPDCGEPNVAQTELCATCGLLLKGTP